MKKGLLILTVALMTMVPMGASAAIRGAAVFGGPVYGGWYAPYWGSYWGPYGYGSFPNSGEVKLDTKVKTAQVFINGAYAGTTHDNHTMHLRPGDYNIEIRENGSVPFAQKVYVTAGKTLTLHPEL